MQNVVTQVPDDTGHFGPYGGMFVPETLMAPLHELTVEYELAVADPDFRNELKNLLEEYAGRPTPRYFAGRMTEQLGGARICSTPARTRSTTRSARCCSRGAWARSG